jgi:hypothetical protein
VNGPKQAQYDEFEASELYCSNCRKAQPVRKHLLLVLAQGNKYDYRCSVCGNSVGSKMDDDKSSFSILAPK